MAKPIGSTGFYDHFLGDVMLVGGAITILKNMNSSMGRIIPYIIMENKIKKMKPPTSYDMV